MASRAAVAEGAAVAVGSMNFAEVSVLGMAILLGWGLGNLSIGLFHCRLKDESRRYFWQMNFMWGAVNSLIAGFTLRSLFATTPTLEAQNQQINIVGINVLLDVVYMAVGFGLVRRKKASLRGKGYGRSIVAQGGFLLVLDTVLWLALKSAI